MTLPTPPDPSAPLQKGVYEALVAANVCAGEIHVKPEGVSLPYCVIGRDEIEAEYEAGPHTRATVNIAIFGESLLALKVEFAKARTALDAAISVEGFATEDYQFEDVRYVAQPDGLSEGAYASFSYLLIPSE